MQGRRKQDIRKAPMQGYIAGLILTFKKIPHTQNKVGKSQNILLYSAFPGYEEKSFHLHSCFACRRLLRFLLSSKTNQNKI
jgi:hypothetical protein